MPSPLISSYGIAFATELHDLCQMVNNLIKDGFQPCINSGVSTIKMGEETLVIQVMVKYKNPLKKRTLKPKPTAKK